MAESDLPPKPEQVEVLFLRLKSWWDSRPISLNPAQSPTPENVLAAMRYHCSNIRLVQPFLGRDSSLERVRSYRSRAQHISSTSIKELRRLLTCFRALSSLSSFIFYAQPLFRLLAQSCQSLDIRLPIEVVSTLDHYQSEQWTKKAASVVSSQYVADVRKATTDTDNGRMDAVIAQWDALTLADKNSGHPSTGRNKDAAENADG